MAFHGSTFSYNGVSCVEHGLMIYDFGSNKQGNGKHSSIREPIEDTLPRKYSVLHYGSTQNTPLEFSIVFGLCTDRLKAHKQLDRWEIEEISRWLTGEDGYHYLEIDQDDMFEFRFKCRVSSLERVEEGWDSWAFKCTIICDSPFAYTYPEKFTYMINGKDDISFFNRSSYMGLYRPQITITLRSSTSRDVKIENLSLPHNHRDDVMEFNNIPTGISKIYIDTDTKVIYTDSGDNIYPHFNFRYTGLCSGDNTLSISGDCTADFLCEFPVSIGG